LEREFILSGEKNRGLREELDVDTTQHPIAFDAMPTLAHIPSYFAGRSPDRAAIRFGGGALSWDELDRRSSQVAYALRSAGVEKNDHIAFLGKGSADFFALMFGAAKAGAILTPMTSWQGAWDMMSGKPAGEGTEEDMLAAGYHFHALKGNGFLDPQRIADSVLYLNSDLASSVTGVTLPVDAGHLLLPGMNAEPVRD
jgi:hypothetical protein